MRRRLLNLALAVSLMVLIPAVVFWVRSHRTQDYAIKSLAGPDTLFVNSGQGWLSLTFAGSIAKYKGGWFVNSIPWTAYTAYRPSVGILPTRSGGPPTLQTDVHLPGITVFNVNGVMILPERQTPRSYQALRIVNIHYAWPTGVAAILPAVWLAAWARRFTHRRKPGHCRRCFYDLTGNLSGTCPECGAAVDGRVGI